LETPSHASKRLLQVQRCKLPGKRLSLLDEHEAINGRATGGADRRSLGLKRHDLALKDMVLEEEDPLAEEDFA